jgi:hypothetical protein
MFVPDEPLRILSMMMQVSMFDLSWIGWTSAFSLRGWQAVKEMPASASLPLPSVHLPKRTHVCGAAQLEIMETDVDSCPWRDEYVTVLPDIRGGHLTVPDTPDQEHGAQRGGGGRPALEGQHPVPASGGRETDRGVL